MQYNGGMSWRIGATSYVYPGDLAHNLRNLAGEVQDVELVLFEDEAGNGNLPTAQEARRLRRLLDASAMSVSVHLPSDLGGAIEPERRARALALNRRTVEATLVMEPRAWIVHVETEGAGTPVWTEHALADIAVLGDAIGDLSYLAVENLESYAPELLTPVFAALPVARTLDIGHLWKQQRDPLPVMATWLPAARVVHLHGVEPRKGDAGVQQVIDHLSLACMESTRQRDLDAVLAALLGWRGVLTLEVFEQDYFTSRAAFDRALERIQATRALHVA